MFSATWPVEVQKIGSSYMKAPVRVTVGERDRLVSNHDVKQHVYVMEQDGKEPKLFELLKRFPKNERVLVFGLYKKECARLEQTLQRKGCVDF
jgi:ATP-dependent RNA helicase DBP3